MTSETKLVIFKLRQVENLLRDQKKEENLTEKDQEALNTAFKYFGEEYRFKNYSQFLNNLPIPAINDYITELENEGQEEEKKEKNKEQEASIPPELESLVAEYEENQVLLAAEELKNSQQRSVAEQVKIAMAHAKIRERALANKERRSQSGEKFQNEDGAFVTLGSPKSESKTAALAASYKAVQEVASTNEKFNLLSKAAQERIISQAVELNLISVTNVDVAIQSAALLIDNSDFSAEDQKNIADVSSNYVTSVYKAVNTQTQQAATYESQIAENEIVLLQLEKESQSLNGPTLEAKTLQIKSLVSLNQNLSRKIDNLPGQFEVFVNNQTTDFQQFQNDSQKRLQKDTSDRIEEANKKIALLQNNLVNNGVKPHIYTPMDDADQLEAAIRQDLPGTLRPNSGYKAEYTAALIPNSETYAAALLLGKDLTPKLLAEARQFAQNNPDSALGKLFTKRQDIFNSAGSQLRKIADSPLGKEISRATTGISKTFGSVTKFFGDISDKIPGGFGAVFRVIQDPWGALRSWAGRKAGEFIYNQLAQRLTNEALKQGAEILLKNGLKEGVKKLAQEAATKMAAKLAAKTGAKIALEAAATAIPIPLVNLLIAAVIEIGSWIIDKFVGAVKALGKSIYGEEVKARDVIAAPAMGLAGIFSGVAAFFGSLGTATVAAASSAVGIITVGTIIGLLFYITSFAVAPLLSTLVQLQSTSTAYKPGTCSNNQAVLDRAKFLSDNLQKGFNGYYNKSPDYPELWNAALYASNPNPEDQKTTIGINDMFWCNFLPYKSYNSAGKELRFRIIWMIEDFQSKGVYYNADQATISDICPGMVVIWDLSSYPGVYDHVGLVYEVTADGFSSLESNAPYKTMFYPVDSSGHFESVGNAVKIKPVVFGTL
jgi:hypothetical protein